jgi:two-component system, cell cycle sensor histidine kinase and response regulator CckA
MSAEAVILLIEDDPNHAELARRAFERAAPVATLYHAETLAEARAVLKRELWPAPDVVLSDLRLPDGSALELLDDDVPLVIMTSQGDEQQAVSAIKGGALDYVVKSSEMFRDLPLTIERALRAAQRERERLVAEASLRESEARFRQLADNIQEAFWLYDLQEARMVYASPAWGRVYGSTPASLASAASERLRAVHAEDRERVTGSFEHEAPHRALAQAFRVVDGERIRWVEERTFPVPDQLGRPYRVAGLGADVTRRRELEQNLHQAQKLEAIGQLAGGVAHDFNNMLTAIMAAADELGQSVTDVEQLELCGMISGASDRAAELTRGLLSFSRKGKLHAAPLDLHEVIRDTVRLLERSIDRRVQLSVQLEAAASVVVGDPAQLQNALLNLGINARDAMPTGGELHISTQVCALDAGACAQLSLELAPGEYLQVSVRDTGTGISREIQGRIFEPFFTTKPVGQGTGLGLAAVYGIAADHGGAVRVESELHRGSVFHLYLPLSGLACAAASPSVEGAPGSGLVLLVDDEPLVRDVGRRLLSSLGYQVLLAEDGERAVRAFQMRHAELVAVLCDMVMPVLSGVDAMARMREINPAVPVILCSGYPRDERSGSGERPAASDAFLSKPFHRSELARVLGRVARRLSAAAVLR